MGTGLGTDTCIQGQTEGINRILTGCVRGRPYVCMHEQAGRDEEEGRNLRMLLIPPSLPLIVARRHTTIRSLIVG